MYEMKPFELWLAKLPLSCDTHRHIRRPVVIVSEPTDGGWVSVVPCTTDLIRAQRSTHVLLQEQGLHKDSRALCERVQTVQCTCLVRRIGTVYQPFDRYALHHALASHFGLGGFESSSSYEN